MKAFRPMEASIPKLRTLGDELKTKEADTTSAIPLALKLTMTTVTFHWSRTEYASRFKLMFIIPFASGSKVRCY
uniref:Uncharacterized protein MANES_03G036800 n=1 Tax=Rhizophora mucronata TaxID=61149 RepID=A0A2P2IXD5_RHIMU